MTKSTSGEYGQFETSPEANDQELLTALCERRQTDRLKTNYRIDYSWNFPFVHGLRSLESRGKRYNNGYLQISDRILLFETQYNGMFIFARCACDVRPTDHMTYI